MNKVIRYFFLSITVAILFSSCTSSLKIRENLVANKQSIFYLSESPKRDKIEGLDINSPQVTLDSSVSDITTVENKGSFFIPLLFFNYWEANKECNLGVDAFEESPELSFKKSFIKDVNRSAIFGIDSLRNSEYSLEISIDQFKANGPYNSQGFYVFALFVYFSSFGDYAGPANVNMEVSYRLKKGGEVLSSNSYSYSETSDILDKGYKNKKELISLYSTSMAESTSFIYRNAVSDIIKDLNNYFN